MAITSNLHLIIFFLIAIFTSRVVSQCEPEQSSNNCINKSVALPLKLIAIAAIIITSMINDGCFFTILSRSIPSLQPDRDIFTIIKAFASGIILATGFMHVLPDSFNMLRSKCLSGNHWHKFPFTGFHCYVVLEFGIVVHSIVIGLSLGASNNTCTIKPLNVVTVFFFSATTPFGIEIGIALSNVYKGNSPTSLITEGLLNASSSGLLIYMALVDLLASDFMGPKLQGSIKLQLKSYAAVLLGAGGMSLLAKWA
ncbi:transport protein 1-like [Ranunculus cassubicifolius]